MFERLNRDRAASGLPPLEYDEHLADIGRAQSEDMRLHHFFAHESPMYGALDDRFDRAGYVAKVARENLAEAPDVETAQDGLMKSPHHHENIMARDVTKIGIGIVRAGVKDPQISCSRRSSQRLCARSRVTRSWRSFAAVSRRSASEPAAGHDRGAKGIGIAVRDGRDARGRPAKQVLDFIGQ